MKKILFAISVIICFMNMKCSDENIEEASDNLLVGTWVESTYDNGKIIYKKSESIPDEDYSLTFKANGELILRSSGWCGTPPLIFYNQEGSWQLENNIVSIWYEDFYPASTSWGIVSLTNDELVLEREYTEQEKDHQALMELYEEVSALSISVPCTDANDWTFTAYGSKACGGPQGYIAYSTKIDVASFLDKIEAYTEAEKAYNIKWDIVSTCDLPAQPKTLECHYGYPVLKY